MNVLVKKAENVALFKFEFIAGSIFMALAMLAMPIGIIVLDVTLFVYPIVVGVVLIAMLFFGLVGYFIFIRPYKIYCKTASVLAETDGEYLYIHGNKEAKIPLAELTAVSVRVELPYIMQKEFLREFIIQKFSEEYGDIIVDIDGFGEYKLRFVSYAENSADEFYSFFERVLNSSSV